jgi:hypothetical protein
MGKVSIICVILVFALLLEDGSSVRKKTKEEEKEDEEMAKAVNATLAAEEEAARKEDEEKRKRDHQDKKKKIQERNEEDEDRNEKEDSQDEACLPTNITCPIVKPCPDPTECPKKEECPEKEENRPCKEEDCPRCGPCPEVKPCDPCFPCPGVNATVDKPPTVTCPEVTSMSTAVAMIIGAVASLLVAGVATGVGLLLRYVPPIASGFLFLATIVLIWYLCSQYPDTARELGGRAATLLREAAVALGHRIMEAIRHREEQVGFLIKPNLFFRMSSMFFI